MTPILRRSFVALSLIALAGASYAADTLRLPARLDAPLNASPLFESCTDAAVQSRWQTIRANCAFKRTQGLTVHHAFSQNPIWFRFSYRFDSDNADQAVLTLSNYTFARVDFYIIRGNELIAERHTGAALPFASRYLNLREFTFSLPASAETSEVYLRIQSATPLNFTPRIRSLTDTLQKENTDQIVAGLLFGAQAILILYNFFLFLSLRDRSYLFYSFYVLGWLLFETKTTGFLARYILFSLPAVDVVILPGLVYFTLAAFLLFTEHFLYPEDSGRLSRTARRLGTALAVLALPVIFLPQHITIPAGIPLNLCVTGYVAWRAFSAWRSKIPSAGFFLAAVFCSIALLPIFALTRIIPITAGFSFFHFLFHYGVPIILLAEALLLSFALADRYRRLREDKIRQEAEFSGMLQQEKSRINAELHDVIGSDLSLMRFSLSGKNKKPRLGELQIKLDKTLLRLRELVTLNNIDPDLPSRLTHDLTQRAREISEAADLHLQTDIAEIRLSLPQAFHVQRFFAEALTNVARHARAKNLKIRFKEREGYVLLLVGDDGRGMAEKDRAQSAGAGLKNFADRAQRIGARLRISSRLRKGSVVALWIRKYAKR